MPVVARSARDDTSRVKQPSRESHPNLKSNRTPSQFSTPQGHGECPCPRSAGGHTGPNGLQLVVERLHPVVVERLHPVVVERLETIVVERLETVPHIPFGHHLEDRDLAHQGVVVG